MTKWTKEDVDRVLAKRGAAAKPSKYHAQAVLIDGIRFDSKKEGAKYTELKARQAAGDIRDLELQPRFFLWAHVIRGRIDGHEAIAVAEYVADFKYCDKRTGETIIEDVKSPATRTPLYKLKKKLAEACHGITITEV